MRRFLLALSVSLMIVQGRPANADNDAPAVAFVREVGHELPGVLNGAATIEDRRARLQPFIARVVDVPAVARFCLGSYWTQATPQERQDYQALFLAVLVNTIATFSGHYAGTGVATSVTMHPTFTRDDETSVPTTVQAGGAPAADITWIVNMQSQPPKILDVIAGGISLRVTQRSDYVSYLAHHGGDIGKLVAVLRQRALATGGVGPVAAP